MNENLNIFGIVCLGFVGTIDSEIIAKKLFFTYKKDIERIRVLIQQQSKIYARRITNLIDLVEKYKVIIKI